MTTVQDIEEKLRRVHPSSSLCVSSYKPGLCRLYRVEAKEETGGIRPLSTWLYYDELVTWTEGFIAAFDEREEEEHCE